MLASDNNKNDRLKKLAVVASVSVALMLTAMKIGAALYTGSLSILSSLVDSVSDIFASLITFVAVHFSLRPASLQHRYGYGKAEALSSLLQSAFVAGSGLFVVYEGINRFINPYRLTDIDMGLWVICASIVLTLILVAFQNYVVKKTGSLAVSADSLHYVVDLATNGAIVVSLLMVKWFKINWFDTLAAIFISVYLLWNAYGLAKVAVYMLLDRELPEDIRKKVYDIVNGFDFCAGIHDLRSHDLGGTYMFEFHLELDGNLSLYEAHDMTETVERAIKKEFPNSQVIIHQDPSGLEEDRLDNRLSK
ncbi:MAG: cation diffusion facilitator family transporter [Alphaproteobacteria bacterium]|nr:cation diffusion facilitator family transporter [Alphaproteobacteria bacterium]